MLLTLYYIAATWIQSWRLSSLKRKFKTIFERSGSLVMYKEHETSALEGAPGFKLASVSSKSCSNCDEARIEDLLWYTNNKRCCSVFPKQRIDVNQWISFQEQKCVFPIDIHGSTSATLTDNEKVHVLMEADYLNATSIRDSGYCQLEQFGILKAWKADNYFTVILETDIGHLAKLGATFMMNTMSVDDGMEVIRIESVAVEGRPCLLLNVDTIPVVRFPPRNMETDYENEDIKKEPDYELQDIEGCVGQQMSPLHWQTHVELLKSFSMAAQKAASSKEPVEVLGHTSASVTAGGKAITLDESTVLSIPEPYSDSLKDEKSVDSFHSVSQEMLPSDIKKTNKQFDEQFLSPRESKSSGSFCSLGSASTASVASHGGDRSEQTSIEASPVSTHRMEKSGGSPTNYATVKAKVKNKGLKMKPPNILVFSESTVTLDNVKNVLNSILEKHRYTVYSAGASELLSSPWMDNTLLLVLCGSVPDTLASVFMTYLLNGGRILCLCSDFLHLVLPTFRTAEVREKELVCFSYGRWKQVRMMHHIFCYQSSPAKTRFTGDSNDSTNGDSLSKSLRPPSSVEVLDINNKSFTVNVQVLGTEETWQNPSLLLATVGVSGGKVIFSQVHLELDPAQYESEEDKYKALLQSNKARMEIIQDILSNHLELLCGNDETVPNYTPAYFLGRHELKLDFMNKLHSHIKENNILDLPSVRLQFCGKGVEPPKASGSFLPVLLHSCPENFSTVEYFENLQSQDIGRLVIYSNVMTSSMHLVNTLMYHHGLAVVSRNQTNGIGRGRNVWLSPEGCAMFSLQLHVTNTSYLGKHIPFLQHLVALSVVSAVTNLPGYQELDIHLKWPNDIYVGDCIKIGGLIIKSEMQNKITVCCIGLGVNLNNKYPTTCINSLIEEHNKTAATKIKPLTLEKLLAVTFTELERLLNVLESGSEGVDHVRQLYYKHWLHSDTEVTIVDPQGISQEVKILGIDEYGFLLVLGKDGKSFTVQPDGNSFDMLRGLIAPKIR